jgi:gliding motility-associated-like protein
MIYIPQPEPLEMTIENIKQSFCPDWGDGEITISIEGGTPEYSYSWQDYPDADAPVLSDIKPGWYFISVTDANNCLIDSTIRVTSQSNVCLDIPTAFTPGNNDRANDYWDVTYVDENHQSHKFYDLYPQARVLIYNRWGKLVFEGDINKSYDDGNGIWDGKDNSDRELPVDSYYFLIYLNNAANTEPVKGTITIIR